jgi:hypothetical protein
MVNWTNQRWSQLNGLVYGSWRKEGDMDIPKVNKVDYLPHSKGVSYTLEYVCVWINYLNYILDTLNFLVIVCYLLCHDPTRCMIRSCDRSPLEGVRHHDDSLLVAWHTKNTSFRLRLFT